MATTMPLGRMATTSGIHGLRSAARGDEDLTGKEIFNAVTYGGLASLAGMAGPQILLHEAGHAAAALTVYQNPAPSITITPFEGGSTRYMAGALTPFGQALGEHGSRALVAAAGAAVDVATATALFAVGYKMRKSHPIAGPAMMGYAGMVTLNDVMYAASALGGNLAALAKTGNDFATIATQLGIHPIIPVIALAAILPLEYLLLRHMEKASK